MSFSDSYLVDDRLDETAYLEYVAFIEWQESQRDDVDRVWDEKFALIECECHNNQQNKMEAPF
jgi:hypothetical protein